jgi:hypothetical protein
MPQSSRGISVLAMPGFNDQEATAVNVILGYLAGKGDDLPNEVVRSLETLANRAYNRRNAGWSEKSVREQWPSAFEAAPPE